MTDGSKYRKVEHICRQSNSVVESRHRSDFVLTTLQPSLIQSARRISQQVQPALPHSRLSLSVYLSSPRRVQPEAAAGVRPALGVARQQEVAEQRPAAPAEAGGRRAAAAVQVQAVARGAQLRHGAAAGRPGAQRQERLPHLQGLRPAEQNGERFSKLPASGLKNA